MEKEFKIIVACNNDEHVKLIQDDIHNAIAKRTTIYYISEAKAPLKLIADHLNLK